MAAVIRLKRHLDDEPLSAIVLNCKKRKTLAESDYELSTILTFAGTVNNPDEEIASHLSKLNKNSMENSYKKHIPNITSKTREETNAASKNNRYKVVNLFRSIDKDREEMASNNLPITVLDVESEDCQDNQVKTDDFVYDLYYTKTDKFNPDDLDSEFKICSANEITFDDGVGVESDGETDDSNDENNWRNDYPDESSDDSDQELGRVVKNLSIYERSSDTSLDDFMTYGYDSDEDHDSFDHNRYWEMYSRFKRGQKREEEAYNKDFYNDETDDMDDYYD